MGTPLQNRPLSDKERKHFDRVVEERAKRIERDDTRIELLAQLHVAALIIEHEYGDEHLANDVRDLIPETQQNQQE